MMYATSFILALSVLPVLHALKTHETSSLAANPVRKVVSLLQSMQKKVTEQGEKDKQLYDQYMCYCQTNGGALSGSISAGEAKTASLATGLKEAEAQLVGLKEALTQAQSGRSAAKAAMAEGTAIREKQAAAFATEKAMYDANIAAIVKAVAALDKGMAGTFLQTDTARVLKTLALSKQDMLDVDRQDLLAFLSGTENSEYAPQSGQISGILKTLGDDMAKSLAEATAAEEADRKSHEELMSAKSKEVAALTASIEAKMTRIGELGVEIAQMKIDLTDTQEAILSDTEFRANLEKGCSSKAAEWAVIVKTRAEELVALAETVKVLNDDDSLDLFKKTLPSSAASFVQLKQGMVAQRARALVALKGAIRAGRPDHAQIDLIAMALHGKKNGFGKIIKMIDTMVETLKHEQLDDDHKKEYCAAQFDSTDDKKKGLERTVSDEAATISDAEEGIAALKDEIAAVEDGLKTLDKSVVEATEQRKEEHADFTALMASDSAAKELLGFAKNRMNKFYNPKLYKAPPKVELSAEDRVFVSEGGTLDSTEAGGIAGTGITVLAQQGDAPPPPPASFGTYAKKSGESSGVIAMMDLLIKDLDKEMTESVTAEKDAQGDYEVLMSDSAAKRIKDSALLTEKTAAKAGLEGDLETHSEALAAGKSELAATLEYIGSLHAECDWLLQYFDTRMAARATEVDALKNAKAVLSGADYAFM